MNSNLFPYIFGRTCSAPFCELEHFVLKEYNFLLKSFIENRNLAESVKTEIVEILYLKIRAAEDDNTKKQLLNLKRDIFNDRDISKYQFLKEVMNDNELLRRIHLKNDIANEYDDLIGKTSIFFKKNIYQSIKYLKQRTAEPYFKNGLLFSTSSLIESLDKLLSNNNSKLKKKEKRACLSLLRYYLRSVAKTTPFSSFNEVFLCDKTGKTFKPVTIEKKKSHINISNLIYLILKRIFENDTSLRETLEISINPTFSKKDNVYEFFYNNDNNEGFYKIDGNGVLSFTIDFLRKNDGRSIYNILVNELCEAVDGTRKQILNYIDGMIKKGIIILHSPVDMKDSKWPQKLVLKFNELRCHIPYNKTLENLQFVLEYLISSAKHLEMDLDFLSRKEIIDNCLILINSKLLMTEQIEQLPKVQKLISNLTPPDLFYEDTLTGQVFDLDIEKFGESLSEIAKLNTTLNTLSYKTKLRREIAKCFSNENFEENKVPLLLFYRDYFLKKNVTDIKSTIDYQLGYYTKFEIFFKALSTNNEDKIDLYSYFPSGNNDEIISLDIFAQTGKIEGKITLVLNNFSNCFITKTSRFINYFPNLNIEGQVKTIYKETYKESEVCELIDASIHNTNTIPYFTDKIIDMSFNSTKHSQLNLNELFISINSSGQPIIINNENKRIIPVDFSMEGISRKSSLMRFFDIFSDANNEGLSTLVHLYEMHIISLSPKEREYVFVPRLYFTDKVVLSRKKWIIYKHFLNNFLSNDDNEPIQFVKFNRWREKQLIPNHVFIKDKRTNNQSKPQYIDFKSPFIFQLFKKIVLEANDVIEVVEMLPAPDQLTFGNTPSNKVNEFIFSIYNL